MKIHPCPTCGYDSREALCPHCEYRPEPEAGLGPHPVGAVPGILAGFAAVPRGLYFLATTRGVKRWLFPPLLVTSTLLAVVLWWTFSFLHGLSERHLPEGFELGAESWSWIEGLGESWGWLQTTVLALIAALEWSLNLLYGMLTSDLSRLAAYFFLGSLVVWYLFSIAYEALAGPFLDEIQARLEGKWFRSDPRSRLERPNDIPPERCLRLSLFAGGAAAVLLLALWWIPGVAWWAVLPSVLLPFGLFAWRDRRYGEWLAWVGKVEGRALIASLQASLLTGILLVFALPLYFVPLVGYVLFAVVCGFATAIGLLDIPFERRGWSFRQRAAFVFRFLLPLMAFGTVSGFLLAVPFVGPVLMVPAASIGGAWLLCRLDKTPLRPRESRLQLSKDRPGS